MRIGGGKPKRQPSEAAAESTIPHQCSRQCFGILTSCDLEFGGGVGAFCDPDSCVTGSCIRSRGKQPHCGYVRSDPGASSQIVVMSDQINRFALA